MKKLMVMQCDEGDTVRMDGQLWRVGGVARGGIDLYGITRRSIRNVAGTTVVERDENS